MWKKRISAIVLLGFAVFIGYFTYNPAGAFPYKLGLDLSGGTHLVYQADTAEVAPAEVADAMEALATVVERRVNLFNVSEPLVQVETGGTVGSKEYRLIVELPGVSNLEEAIKLIGKTPVLDFRLIKDGVENLTPEQLAVATDDDLFVPTGLSGRLFKKARLEFDPTLYAPQVGIEFNEEGRDLFAKITKQNVGKVLAIFLDGQRISAPVIQNEISNGQAVINGSFSVDEARALVRDLNYGALPVPIELVSTQTIGATLGAGALSASLRSGLYAFIAVALFLLFWYRIPGLVAVLALGIYTVLNLAVFKFISVTLTSAGIAGFILSLGMAVDANILIFERMKEEIKRGKQLPDAIREGFGRAWLSIRDSNTSSIITSVILYYFASTPVIKGFALVFGLGVVISMFSAITASRTLLMAFGVAGNSKISKFLFGSGVRS